jgi:DnaJ-class molecular chaperone
MRRAMANYHPDRCAGMTIVEQVEAEAIFAVLKDAYESINQTCNS